MTPSRCARPAAAAIVVSLVLTACTVGQQADTPREDGRRVDVGDGSQDTTVRWRDARLVAPAGGVEPGSEGATLSARDGGQIDDPLFPGSGASESIVFESTGQLREPVTVELPYDPADYETFGEQVTPVMYVLVEELGTWVPVPSTAVPEDGIVRAETRHLSRWGLGAPLYLLGRVTGDRAAELDCADQLPNWVEDAFDVDDINAAVFGCAEADGEAARIRLRSNRGSPILLEMNAAMEVVDGDVVSREFTKAAFGARAGGIFLAPKETVELRLEQPETTTNYEMSRAGSASDRAAMYFLHFVLEHVGDGSLAIDLARCASELLGRDLDVTAEAATDLVGVAQSCVEPRLELWQSTGVISDVTFSRLSSAFGYFRFADELVTALDATVVDATGDLAFSLLAHGSRRAEARPDEASGPTVPEGGLQAPAVMLVVDVSGSMSDDDGTGRVKLDGAREAIVDFAERLPGNTYLGVRTYPHEATGATGCSPGTGAVPLGPVDPTAVSALVRGLVADGQTPTSAALEAAAGDLREVDARAATIVLVSDGQSNCGPPPCDTAGQIASSGIDVSVNTIGFRIDQQGADELECIAKASRGVHVDVDNSAELIERTAELSRPSYNLTVTHPQEVASATAGSAGEVVVTAEITSNGATAIRDGQVFIEFGPQHSPGIVSPRRRLGNLAPGVTVRQEWRFNTPLDLDDRDLSFEVVATGDNIEPRTARGSIEVEGDVTTADTGPVLRDAEQVVILGDSYSSGEGAGKGRYVDGTADGANRCHRSMMTYGRSLWGEARTLLACSGAETVDMWQPNADNPDEPPQLDQLAALTGDDAPDLVLLTLGGNDIGFKDIVLTCVLPLDCHEQTSTTFECVGATDCGLETTTFEDWTMSHVAGLPNAVRPVYREISRTVNAPGRRVDRNGRVAPIVVLGYPSPAPRNPAARGVCARAFSPEELSFANRVIDALNTAIEDTVDALRRTEDLPIYFAREVQRAFLPDHTYCDDVPFVNRIGSYRPDVTVGQSLLGPEPHVDLVAPDRLQELVHPTPDGYRAMTGGLARWSVTDEARAPVPTPPEEGTWSVPPELGDPVATFAFAPEATGTSLRMAETYEVTTDGSAPDSRVELRIASTPRLVASTTADGDGAASLAFVVPSDLPIGRHHLELASVDQDGTLSVRRLPITIVRPRSWVAVGAAVSSLLLVALALLLRRRARR